MIARQTFTLDEVATAYLPPDWTDGVRWLSRRLNKGQLKGIRVGRTWMMRQSDIDFMLSTLSNDDKVAPQQPEREAEAPEAQPISLILDGLSARSRNRLRGAR